MTPGLGSAVCAHTFSQVSALVHFLCKATIKSTFENFCLASVPAVCGQRPYEVIGCGKKRWVQASLGFSLGLSVGFKVGFSLWFILGFSLGVHLGVSFRQQTKPKPQTKAG